MLGFKFHIREMLSGGLDWFHGCKKEKECVAKLEARYYLMYALSIHYKKDVIYYAGLERFYGANYLRM